MRLDQGLAVSAADYIAALQGRARAQEALLSSMAEVDVMLTPGLGGKAGRLETRTVDVDGAAFSF